MCLIVTYFCYQTKLSSYFFPVRGIRKPNIKIARECSTNNKGLFTYILSQQPIKEKIGPLKVIAENWRQG